MARRRKKTSRKRRRVYIPPFKVVDADASGAITEPEYAQMRENIGRRKSKKARAAEEQMAAAQQSQQRFDALLQAMQQNEKPAWQVEAEKRIELEFERDQANRKSDVAGKGREAGGGQAGGGSGRQPDNRSTLDKAEDTINQAERVNKSLEKFGKRAAGVGAGAGAVKTAFNQKIAGENTMLTRFARQSGVGGAVTLGVIAAGAAEKAADDRSSPQYMWREKVLKPMGLDSLGWQGWDADRKVAKQVFSPKPKPIVTTPQPTRGASSMGLLASVLNSQSNLRQQVIPPPARPPRPQRPSAPGSKPPGTLQTFAKRASGSITKIFL